MLEKIKAFFSTPEISWAIFFIGAFIFGSSMSIYISSYAGATVGVMFWGIMVMLIGFLLNVM